MKKLIATVLIALIAFAAFAGISVTLDTITSYSSNKTWDPLGETREGFRITGAEFDDSAHGGPVLGELTATMGKDSVASANVSIRFRTPVSAYEGAAVKVHGWEITARLFSGFKISVGNRPYEVFSESVSWEPVSGAGLFEQGNNRIYVDYTPDFLSDLNIIAGVSLGSDSKKPLSTLQVAAIYDIPQAVKIAFEFHNVAADLGSGVDGDTKAFCAQIDYTGTENLDLVAGYCLVRQGGYTVQHRVDLMGTLYTEKFGLEFYDAFIMRLYDGEKNGNRLGAKISFYATEKLTPFVKVNWFKNYGYASTVASLAWGDWQLSRDPGVQGGNIICLDAGFGLNLSSTLSGTIGGAFKINLTEGTASDQKFFWSIPLCLTASFS